MARLGGRSSESLSIPTTGLASILTDHEARSNVLLGTLGLQTPSVVSSPESSVSEVDIGEDDPDELKEEDIWAAEAKFLEPDLSKPTANGAFNGDSSFGHGFNKQNLNVTGKSSGSGLGFGKAERDSADSLEVGLKAKRKENGAVGDVFSGFERPKTNAGEVVRSSSWRRERGSVVAGAFVNGGGVSRHNRPFESPTSSHIKSPSRRSTASWMIPQVGGVNKHSSRRHAERQSAPVEVPDWSQIMVKHKVEPVAAKGDGEGGKDDDDDRLPPHELLAREYARSQRTTFSVCEGQGRTLKGRDLSRVRDAVWSQMGFAD